MAANTDNIKWIFFDMGYTLVNEEGAQHARNLLTVEQLRRAGKPIRVEEFEAMMLETGRTSAVFPYFPIVRELGGQKRRYCRAMEVAYPASASTLARLHKRYKLGIIASQPGGSLQRLQQYGLFAHLDLIYSSDEIGLDKSDPAFFAAAIRAAGCAPDEAVMVGDRLDNDVFPAKSVGMVTVRLRQGIYQLAEPADEAHTPDFDLPSIGDLPALFGC